MILAQGLGIAAVPRCCADLSSDICRCPRYAGEPGRYGIPFRRLPCCNSLLILLRSMELPCDKPYDPNNPYTGRDPDLRMGRRICFDIRKTEHQAAKAKNGKHHRKEICFGRSIIIAEIPQPDKGEDESDNTCSCKGEEYGTPS